MTPALMSTSPLTRRSPQTQLGASIVEIMVGLLIGMIAMLVIFQVYEVTERYKRNTMTTGDAQTTGVFVTFYLAREIGNAGSVMSLNAKDLGECPNATIESTLRPLPIVIVPGATEATPDQILVFYGASPTIATSVPWSNTTAAPGEKYEVQSPNGFAVDDLIVAVNTSTRRCAMSRVTAAPTDLAGGFVTITHTGAAETFNNSSILINFGHRDRATRVLFDVDAVGGALRSTNLIPPMLGEPRPTPVPLAANIMNLKAQYGLDTDGNGLVDTWMTATDGNWTPAQVLVASATKLNQIKAIRIGVVVRGDEPDREITAAFDYTLFDCGAACAATKISGAIPAPVPPELGYRYRVFETVVPLRNAIWNKL